MNAFVIHQKLYKHTDERSKCYAEKELQRSLREIDSTKI